MRPTLLSPSDYAKAEQFSQHNRNRQHRIAAKYNAIVNACVSSHAGGPGSTSATDDGVADYAASGSPIAAKSDDDGGDDGDGDPDSSRNEPRRPVSSLPSTFTPVQRAKSSRILRMPGVVEKIGLSRSTIYEKMKNGEFVSPVRLGARAIGFFESEIDSWLESRASRSETA